MSFQIPHFIQDTFFSFKICIKMKFMFNVFVESAESIPEKYHSTLSVYLPACLDIYTNKI